MRAIVTGGTGFIGASLAKELTDSGHEVLITGRSGENKNTGRLLGYDFGNLPWGDLGHIDCLFHQAACTDTTCLDLPYQLEINLYKPLELFRQAIAHGCGKIVYASSCSVYGDTEPPFKEDGPVRPLHPYARAKLELDYAVEKLEADIVGLRYTNVYGPGERHKGKMASVLSQIYWSMRGGRKPRLFKGGEQMRDWVYVKDVVRANVCAVGKRGVYNIGSSVSVSFNDLVKAWNSVLGTNHTPEYIDNPHRSFYQSHTSVDMSKCTWYEPNYRLAEGMKNYIEE